MQVINKKIIVIFICLIIFIFGLFKLFNKKEIVLDDVILDMQKHDNTFAIYVEEGKNNYNEKEIFPEEGYVFNEEKSQCMSIDGNIIDGILSYDYDNKKLIVDTTDSINCYLYFDKGAGLEIMDMQPKPNGLNLETTNSSADWTGMYRFQGQQEDEIENYICFGTSDSNECKSYPEKYMYRIIGIEESGRVKVIKKEALEETDQWWTDYNTNVYWNESLIFKHINDTTFLKNTELVPKGWEDKIDNNNWLFGSMHSNNTTNGARQTGIEVYKIESGQKEAQWDEKAENENEEYKGVKAEACQATLGQNIGKTYYYIRHTEKWTETERTYEVDAKIGLMYISDYYLSVNNEANCQATNHTYDECLTGWIHLSKNDSTPPQKHEWTMTRFGWNVEFGTFDVLHVRDVGWVNTWNLAGGLSVRPVFFLKNNISLIDGKGTIDEPFIIE